MAPEDEPDGLQQVRLLIHLLELEDGIVSEYW